MKKLNFFALIVCFLAGNLFAESMDVENRAWRQKYGVDDSLSIQYLKGERTAKHSGYKPFMRAWDFYYKRAYPTGNIPNGYLLEQYETLKQTYPGFGTKNKDNIVLPNGKGGNTTNQNTIPDNANWEELGPTNSISGRITCLAIHPTDPTIIYAGSASGGIWKTTNGGDNWFALDQNIPSLAIGAIALRPGNPNEILVGTGEPNGFYPTGGLFGVGLLKSTDGGNTWNTTNLSYTYTQQTSFYKIAYHPTGPDTIFAASRNGLFRTSNNGLSWNLVNIAGWFGDVCDFAYKQNDPLKVVCAIRGVGVFYSSNGGATWTQAALNSLPSGNMGRIAIAWGSAPGTESQIYCVIERTNTQAAIPTAVPPIPLIHNTLAVMKSTNNGQTWNPTKTWNQSLGSDDLLWGQGWYDIIIATDRDDPNTVYAGGVTFFKSTDGGVNFTEKPLIHADLHAIIQHPTDPDIFFVGSDGGVCQSTNNFDGPLPPFFTTPAALNKSNGLAVTQFVSIATHPSNITTLVGGTQDNGTLTFSGSASGWIQSGPGDGGQCEINYNDPNIVYGSSQNLYALRATNGATTAVAPSNNGWGSFSPYNQGLVNSQGQNWDRCAFYAPIEIHRTDPNILYAGTYRVWKKPSVAANWTPISGDLTSGGNNVLTAIAISPSSSNRIYTGSNDGRVTRTTDEYATPATTISAGLPNRTVTSIAVRPTNFNTVYVTYSGFGGGHIFRTENADNATPTWTNISPPGTNNLPFNSIVIDPIYTTNLYAASDLGVFFSPDEGVTWYSFDDGLPNVFISELRIQSSTNTLVAASMGRGMWKTSLSRINLTESFPLPSGWSDSIVPRNSNDATPSNVALPSTLSGNTNTTYLNWTTEAEGTGQAAAHTEHVYIDGEYWTMIGNIGDLFAGQQANFTNAGPITVRGGRHTIKDSIDVYNKVPESNESDNYFQRQFVWSPLNLTAGNSVQRAEAPQRGPYVYRNCDGFSFTKPFAYAFAVGIISEFATADYDLRLYSDYSSSTSGFSSTLKTSEFGAGYSEFIVGTYNTSTSQTYAGVYDYENSNSNYRIQFATSTGNVLTLSTPLNGETIAADNILKVYEVYLNAGNYYDFFLENTGGVYLGMSLYSSETNYYAKSEAIYYSNYFGSTSNGSFTALAPSSGYYTLVVWKKGFLDLAFAANYNLTVSPSLSNLFVYAPSWSHTVVARNDWSATPSNCNVSPTLDGWLATTYVNGGIALSGVTNAGAFTSKFFLDDVLKYTQNYSSGLLAGTQTYTQNTYLPSIVKGGKHTLSFQIDSENQITESNETDNWTSQQFDWSPKTINPGTGWVVDSPPPQVSAGAVYPNSEAWSFSRDSNHWWSGCAVVPTVSGLDYDIALYPNYTGSTNNYQTVLAASQMFLDQTDFVLVNGNNVSETTFCGAVLNYSGTVSPGIDHEVYADNETGTYYPSQLDGVTDVLNGSVVGQDIEIFRIYEVAFGWGNVPRQYQFTLNNLSGNADLNFALYSKNGTYLALSNFYTDPSGSNAIGHFNGTGIGESFTVTVAEAGYYALVVWKRSGSDLYLDASYSLDVSLTPINLTAQTIPSGWSAPLVPRNQTGATSSDCLVTPTLDGNVSNTHWNVSMVNEGQNPTSNYFYTDYEIDDVWDFSLNGSLAANTTWTLNDFAPTVVRGGRHVLKTEIDGLNDVAETNEYDNVYTKEYVWSPLPLSAGVPVNRTSPPNWSTTGSVYGNCDGFSATMPVSKFWLGGAAVPTVTGTQVGILLYDDYTGSETGFQNYLTVSGYSTDLTQFVIANKNTVPTSDYQLGVTNYFNYPNDDFVVEAVNENSTITPGVYTNLDLPANSVLDLYELIIGNGQLGQYTFTLGNDAGNTDLNFSLYSKDLTYGGKFDFFVDNLGYWAYGNANTEGQGETFTINLSEAGYYCLAVWKNGTSDVALNAVYSLSVELSPSNLTALTTPAGWSSPLVARNQAGATSSDCLVTPTLDGNVNTNYINSAITNNGINGTGSFNFDYFVDDVLQASGSLSDSYGNTTYHNNNIAFWNPTKGGRHVLKTELDGLDNVGETNELDNIFTKEYVWSPLPLSAGVPVNRTSPPNWLTYGSVYGNCDGFSATTPAGKFWLGGAAVPTISGTNVGVLLYDDYTGSETGFQSYLTVSNVLGDEINFVIANKNTVPTSDYQLGVTNYYNYLNADFVVEAVNENYVLALPGIYPNLTLPANSVLDLYELSFAQTGTYVFTLTNTAGNTNLGFSLYSKDLTYGGKFGFFVDNLGYWAYGNANTEGQGETFTVNISETGYYCLAVWKNGTSDVGLNATYGFSVLPQATTPQAITDLHIQKTGNNAVLTWSAVSGATNYKVYGSTEPNFVPAPGNLLDTVTATNYTHTNGMGVNSKFFYKVTVNNTVAVSPMKKESFDLK